MKAPPLSRGQIRSLKEKEKKKKLSEGSELDQMSRPSQPPLSASHCQVGQQAQQTITMQFVQLPKSQYEDLIRENTDLKQRVMILENGKQVLEQTIRNGEQTITQLTAVNAALQARIVELFEIISSINLKSSISNFSMAIIDLLKEEKLFDQLAAPVQPVAQRLKKFRMGGCQYVHHDDTTEVKTYKRYILREKLSAMPQIVMNQFEKVYPGVIKEIKLYLDTHPPALPVVCEEERELVQMWWS